MVSANARGSPVTLEQQDDGSFILLDSTGDYAMTQKKGAVLGVPKVRQAVTTRREETWQRGGGRRDNEEGGDVTNRAARRAAVLKGNEQFGLANFYSSP